jgi:hypothetical protein
MQHRPVNSRQLEVLRWIANGCPDGVMPDSSHKTTAVALRNRGLAIVSTRGGWHAQVTDAGRHYLEHGRYPGDEKALAPAPASKSATTPKPRPAKKPVREDVAARPEPEERGEPPAPPRRTIPVPQQLRRPHPVVAALRDRKPSIVSKSVLPRALRILHALAVAAEREGWKVQSASVSRTQWGNEWDSRDHLVINTCECCVGIRITQQTDRTPHVPTAHELREKERWSYTRIPDFDYATTDRLTIDLESSGDGRRHIFADRQRWRLDDKLPALLDEIAYRSEAARDRRVEREHEEVERERRRKQAIEHAVLALREDHRAKVLFRQAQDWRTASELRAYLDAMESQIVGLPTEEQTDAQAWLRWCRQSSQGLDPLERPITMPADPEPTDEALRPFLPKAVPSLFGRW